MNRENFVKSYLESLIKKDKDIRKHFEEASDEEKELLKGRLKLHLEESYDSYAKDYFSRGIGSYVSNILRYGGAAADAIGTYLFWMFGGAGFGMKGAGLVAKTAADALDGRYYLKKAGGSGLEKLADSAKIAGEGAIERAAAYLPIGVGSMADLLRGRSKFDKKVISRALGYAKGKFIDYFGTKKGEDPLIGKKGKIIPLNNFRHPAYAEQPDDVDAGGRRFIPGVLPPRDLEEAA